MWLPNIQSTIPSIPLGESKFYCHYLRKLIWNRIPHPLLIFGIKNYNFNLNINLISAKLLSMIGTLLSTSTIAQQQFIQCQGFSVISSQILRSNKNHFSMNLLEVKIYNNKLIFLILDIYFNLKITCEFFQWNSFAKTINWKLLFCIPFMGSIGFSGKFFMVN